jgi:hypothetical protein
MEVFMAEIPNWHITGDWFDNCRFGDQLREAISRELRSSGIGKLQIRAIDTFGSYERGCIATRQGSAMWQSKETMDSTVQRIPRSQNTCLAS